MHALYLNLALKIRGLFDLGNEVVYISNNWSILTHFCKFVFILLILFILVLWILQFNRPNMFCKFIDCIFLKEKNSEYRNHN